MTPFKPTRLLAILCLALASCTSVPAYETAPQIVVAAPDAANADLARARRIDALLGTLVAKGAVPGASALVRSGDEEVYFNAFGMQDRESQTPFTRDTIGRIYSMTKPITATALMMLFDEGKFALDDPLAKHLPEFADLKVFAGENEDGEPILVSPARAPTVRDVLRHTAGLTYGVFSETPVDMMYREKDILGYTRTNTEFSADLATLPLLVQPGSYWIYSVSSDVQGRLVEALSGQSLGEFMQKRILTPLRMKDTGFTVPADQHGRFGPVYQLTKKGPTRLEDDDSFLVNQPFLTDMAFESGGGGLTSTIDDYMRFALMLQNDGVGNGQRLIAAETLAMMRADQLGDINHGGLDRGMSYGLGFGVQSEMPDGALYAQGSFFWGGMAGTFFFVDPANDLTVVFFTQLIGADALKLREQFAAAIYGAPQ